MKNNTIAAISFVSLVLTIPALAVIQAFFDRFYPFANSSSFAFPLALVISLGTAFFVGSLIERRCNGRGGNNSLQAFPGKVKTEWKMPEFAILAVVAMAVCSVCFETLAQSIPILVKHNPKGYGVVGMFAGVQLSKILGHQWGLIVEHPVETKPKEQS